MRLIYIDETGTSGKSNVTTVAAVIVDADKRWLMLAKHLYKLTRRVVPEENWPSFVFHATDIVNGKPPFIHSKYSREQRMGILREIIQIPKRYGVPLAFGYMNESAMPLDSVDKSISAKQLFATISAVANADLMVRTHKPRELAMVISEEHKRLAGMFQSIPMMLRQADYIAVLPSWLKEHLPTTHIVGPIHFSKKLEDPMLQLADACAYAFQRYTEGREDGAELFQLMTDRPPTELVNDIKSAPYGGFYIPF